MSDVQFEENTDMMSFRSRKILGEATVPTIIQFLIKKGITKSARQSYHLLLWSTITFIVLTIAIFSYFVLGIGSPHKTVYKLPIELKMQLEANKQNNNLNQ
jgi:hypothetical protein